MNTGTGARAGSGVLLLLVAVPLVWSLYIAVMAGASSTAWLALADEPQTWRGLGLSLCSGIASTLLSFALCKHLLGWAFMAPSHRWAQLLRALPPMLAVPHAAFAIGLVALLTPGGWLLRAFSPWATGLEAPPDWPTTQDPWGLGLTAVLVFKETPFLLWVAAMQLQQSDRSQRLRKEIALAMTMGYSAGTAWQRVAWPQICTHLQWPLLAVLAYGLSVVDVALLIGPASTPTLALLTWQWLQDADAAINAQGAAAAWVLLGLIATCAAVLQVGMQPRFWRPGWARGAPQHSSCWRVTGEAAFAALLPLAYGAVLLAYAAVLLALAAGSVVGVWPFPDLLPTSWTMAAWQSVWDSRNVLTTTCLLAAGSAGAAVVWSVAWMEWAPLLWQRRAMQLVYLPLALPSVLWTLGLHRMTISWHVDATLAGLWLVHSLLCVSYVLLAIEPPYSRFNPRMQAAAASLGRSRMAFLWRVKWPLLKAPLGAGFAVGFAVSAAQYLPTLYVGAGRFATVSTEAVNLAAGGQRSLASAFAWLQWLLPLLVFTLAGWMGRPGRLR